MASPQKENGYTPIANEILEHLMKIKLSGTQFRIVMAVWRYTYGFSRKEAPLSETYLAKALNTSRTYVCREIKPLFDMRMLKMCKDATFNAPAVISFNKNYDEWRLLSEQDTGIRSDTSTGIRSDTSTGIRSDTSTGIRSDTQDKQYIKQNIKQKKNLSSEPPAAVADGEKTVEKPKSKRTPKSTGGRRTPVYAHDSPYYKSALWLAKQVEARYPEYKKHDENILQTWADSARLLIDKDNRSKETANKLLIFSQSDDFWQKNIRCMPTFRAQYDQLLAKSGVTEIKTREPPSESPLNTGYINLSEIVRARSESP